MPSENTDADTSSKSKSPADSEKILNCSFCGKSQHQVSKLIAGSAVFICDECVELCLDIIREETRGALANADKTEGWRRLRYALPAHETLRERFFQMAHMLSTANRGTDDRGFRILLAGVKGSGLPAAVAGIWNAFGLPLVRYDAARLRGTQLLNGADMFIRLLEQSQYNLKQASRGAILIENLDRLFEPSSASRIVQEELELILAGTTERVPPAGGRKHPQQENLQLDTSGITFIATTSKLHAGDPPILNDANTPTFRFDNDRVKLSAALVGNGALPGLLDNFEEIREYLPYKQSQIHIWLTSPEASPHLAAFERDEGVLRDDIRKCLVDLACARGAGFDGLISILRLIKLRRSFIGPEDGTQAPIDCAWLERSI